MIKLFPHLRKHQDLAKPAVAARRVLIIAVPALGDVLLCTPLMRSLRSTAPDMQLDALVRSGHGAILEGNSDVNTVLEINRRPSIGETLAQLWRLFRSYDLVISNSTSDRAAIYALVAGRQRISMVLPPKPGTIQWKRWVYNGFVQANVEHSHTLDHTIDLGEILGLRVRPRPVSPRAHNSGAVLAALLGPDWERKEFAILHPTPGLPYKRWQTHGWRSIAEHLRGLNLEVLVTGDANEKELQYLHQCIHFPEGTVTDLAGKLRLGDIPALLERCAVFVGVDTVVTHMAAATGTPTVALFGPSHPVLWGPWPASYQARTPFKKHGSQRVGNVQLLQGPGPCVPCNKLGCLNHPNSRSDCLSALAVSDVVQAINQALSRRARSHHRQSALST